MSNYVVNTESKKIYNVKGTARDADPLSPTYGRDLMKLERLYDGFVPSGRISTQNPKYRPLTEEELAKLARVTPSLAGTGMAITLDHLDRVPAEAARPPEDGADDSDAEDASAEAFLQRQIEAMMPQVGKLVEPTERDTFERIIVAESVKEQLNMGLNLILGREALDRDWGLSEISPMKGRCVMNLVGPPGTGKTASAKAVAKAVGKKLYQVDYSQIISKWVGDTGKHIAAAFAAAKQHDAILFWDEADSLMSKRLEMTDDAVGNSVNQNRNILMQELDRFDGIVLMASNFFQNYDEALLRRIAQHVHYELPNQVMRKKIIDLHLPNATKARLAADVNLDALAKESKGLSGGDILVVCENAIKKAALGGEGKLTHEHLLSEIKNVLKNKAAHKGVSIGALGLGGKARRPMGLHANPESEGKEND